MMENDIAVMTADEIDMVDGASSEESYEAGKRAGRELVSAIINLFT